MEKVWFYQGLRTGLGFTWAVPGVSFTSDQQFLPPWHHNIAQWLCRLSLKLTDTRRLWLFLTITYVLYNPYLWVAVVLWFVSCLVGKSYKADSQNYTQHWLPYPTTKSKTAAHSRESLLRSWQRKNVGVKENSAGEVMWESWSWMLRLELEQQEGTGWGIERGPLQMEIGGIANVDW